jgi:hypothetical protein
MRRRNSTWLVFIFSRPSCCKCAIPRKNTNHTNCSYRYLTFACILIPVKSVKAELADGKFTFQTLFQDQLFFTLIVSLLSTYVLWIFISVVSLDAWHIVTSVGISCKGIFSYFLLTHSTTVIPILPPLTRLRQRNKRLRILQRPRRLLGHPTSGDQTRRKKHQHLIRRQRGRRNLLPRPRRHVRRLARRDRHPRAPRS